MDYKEKYEQALSKAKDMLNYKEVRREDMEYLFPELAESEDEKVRKEIIEEFTNRRNFASFENAKATYDRWLAWLEKQESVDEIVSRCKDSWYNEGKIQGQIEGLSDEEKYQQGWHDALEKQGEKHPDTYNGISFEYNGHTWGMCARDNGVDISCDKHLIKHLEEQGEKLPVGFYYVNSEGKKFYSDTLKYGNVILHVEKQGEASPVLSNSANNGKDEQKTEENKGNVGGISTDEEAVLDALIRRLEGEDVYVSPHLAVECLKSIKGRVHPKQEWSDVDKDILFRIINDLKFLRDTISIDPKYAVNIIDMEREITWLKSIRPQSRWKPTDEQMGCLSDAIEHYNSLGYPASKLKELLDDLKKIKEGKCMKKNVIKYGCTMCCLGRRESDGESYTCWYVPYEGVNVETIKCPKNENSSN